MSKTHNIELHIINNSSEPLNYADDWFQTGRLGDGQSWPQSIPPGTDATVLCYESDFSPVGCSGWVKYTVDFEGSHPIYMAFSNPVVGGNGVAFGTATSVWDSMSAQYFPVSRPVALDTATDYFMSAMIESTSGDTNHASYTIEDIEAEQIVNANLQLNDVVSVFNNIPTTASYRKYYECSDSPTSFTGLAQSHFKGIAAYGDKMLFSHTNLDITSTVNGKIIVADFLPGPGLAATEGTFDTLHPGWPHPCSMQACGSFMALGIQASASSPGSDVSEIQILWIGQTAVNGAPTLLGTIERPRVGINGVGFTKMTDSTGGLYLIAAVNGNRLTLYQSQFPNLVKDGGLQGNVAFNQIFEPPSFPESGAGLALLTQADGSIFLVTMNADDDGSNSKACLYAVTISPTPAVTKVGEKDLPVTDISDTVSNLQKYMYLILPIPVLGPALNLLLATLGVNALNSSFRWGKGLRITSPASIELYASDRNVIPLSHIPVVGSEKDFSVVVWAAGSPPVNPFTDGVRPRDTSTGRIYLVLDGALRWVPNAATYVNLFIDWTSVTPIPTVSGYNIGAPITDGAYLAGGSPDGHIFFVVDGTKRWITDPAVFSRFGFNSAAIRSLTPEQLAAIPDGANIN
jgi:hypothetical protein